MNNHYVIIVAGGRGSRMQSDMPKQYLELAGKTILYRTVEKFTNCGLFKGVRVIIHPDDLNLYEKAIDGLEIMAPVFGGETRQQSVRNGLESLKDLNPEKVLIHDAARPHISLDVIQAVLENIKPDQGAVPGVRVADTIRKVQNYLCDGTKDRSSLWRTQTPQGFMFEEIMKAHEDLADQSLTDDASLFEELGKPVKMVEADEGNFKITTQEDLVRAQRNYDVEYEFRTGQGFDVHKFCNGDHVNLCGVKIPHTEALSGHSDADVALHAITDALLGAIAEGDIGVHFPPTDMQWKGAASDQFLKYALDLAHKKDASITHMDVTIICERPKVGPVRESMIYRLSEILGLETSRISVKGTTTEKLGFTGRKEGIAAQAVVTVKMKA